MYFLITVRMSLLGYWEETAVPSTIPGGFSTVDSLRTAFSWHDIRVPVEFLGRSRVSKPL